MPEFGDRIADDIRLWHGIEPPNEPARRLALQLDELIAAFTRLRTEPALDAAPTDFGATLNDLRDLPG